MNDKKTPKIVLTFDDGRGDNYRIANEVLLKRGLKATFFITTNYVNGEIDKSKLPCQNDSLNIEQICDMSSKQNFEVAGHGANHLNTIEDWSEGIITLKAWLGDDYFNQGAGVASPNCNISIEQIKMDRNELNESGISYVRIGLPNKNNFLSKVLCKLSLITNSKMLFYFFSKASIQKIHGSFIIYSIPVLNMHSIDQVKYLIDRCQSSGKDCVFMFHSILKPDEDFYSDMWTWDFNKFEKLCDYLCVLENEGKIKVEKLIDCLD